MRIDDQACVLFQGDSITDCGRAREPGAANQGLGGGYPLLIAARLLADRPAAGLRFLNRGISGNRVVDLYARWKIDALNLQPQMISILIGVNDTWHEFGSKNGVEPERYGRIYRELLGWTKQALPEVKLVLCEPFVLVTGAVSEAWVPEIAARRAIVRELASEFKAVLVPFQGCFDEALKQAPANYWLGDGVHPTCAGHQLMADAWLRAVAAG